VTAARVDRLRATHAGWPTWARCSASFVGTLVAVYLLGAHPGLLVVYVLAGLYAWPRTRPHARPFVIGVRDGVYRVGRGVKGHLGRVVLLVLAVSILIPLLGLLNGLLGVVGGHVNVVLLPLLPLALVPAPFRFPVLVLVALTALALYGGWRRPRSGRGWEWQRDQLAAVLGPRLYRDWAKFDPKDRVRKVRLTPEWTEPGDVVSVKYPKSTIVTDALEVSCLRAVEQRLGGKWLGQHQHQDRWLRYVRQAPPAVLPESVPYADAPETGRADLLPLGIDATGEWLTVDLTKDPHILVSGRTTSGKSTAARSLVAHVLRHGAQVDICDAKQISLLEFKGAAGVRYYDEPDEFAAAIPEFRAKVEDRKRAAKAGKDLTGEPLLVLVLEEIFQLVSALKSQHGQRRGQPPAMADLLSVLQQGRALRCHVLATSHKPTESALLERDQFAVKIAVGPQSDNTWSLLFGSDPRPEGAGTNVKGRAVIGTASDLTVVQLPYLAPADARRLALQRAPTPDEVLAAWPFSCCGQRLSLADPEDPRTTCDVCGQTWRLPVEWCCGKLWRLRDGVGQSCAECGRDLPWPADEHVWTCVDTGVDTGVDSVDTGVDKNGVHASDLRVHADGGSWTGPTAAYTADVHVDDVPYSAAAYSDGGPERVDRECSQCGAVVNGPPGTWPKCPNRHTVRIPKAAVTP
jgi:hypothetical protein